MTDAAHGHEDAATLDAPEGPLASAPSSDQQHGDPPRGDEPLAETSHVETSHVETSHVETSHVETSHVEASHVEAPPLADPLLDVGGVGVIDPPGLDAANPDAAQSKEAAAERTFVVVEVVNVSFELPSTSPVIHLLEQESPYRGLDFPIGLPEAQSIAYALEGEVPPRPTTHDLLVSVLAVARCEVVAVRLTGERGGTILAELDLMGPKGREVLDCRPTDGIAVALRLRVVAPILCEASLLDR